MPIAGGRCYRYINQLARAEAPTWFYQLLAPKERVANASDTVIELDQDHNIYRAIHFLTHEATPAIEGNGGEFRTMKTAMVLRDRGISEETALELMLDHYNERCDPPWDFDGIKQKVANGYAYASLRPAGGDTAEAEFTDPPETATMIGSGRQRRPEHRGVAPGKRRAAQARRAAMNWE
jgi:hypothetical protein